ncbi:hypothetical protein BASA81_001046 [Batrachochytrium salamandrivorans]|nr:hypothetical protein BASA81_001046 [Batrachochytrium salamandrivorans]
MLRFLNEHLFSLPSRQSQTRALMSGSIVAPHKPPSSRQDWETDSSASGNTTPSEPSGPSEAEDGFPPPPQELFDFGAYDQLVFVDVLAEVLRAHFSHSASMTQFDEQVVCLATYLDQIAHFVNERFEESNGLGSTGVRCLVLGAMYFERKCQRGNTYFASLHREMLICAMVAMKMNEDEGLLNSCWAGVGRLPVQVVNELELQLLQVLGYNLYISSTNFQRWFDALMDQPVVNIL